MEMRIEEKLFFKMMMFSRAMRHGMMPEHRGEHGPHGPHGMKPMPGPCGHHEGPGPFGHHDGPGPFGHHEGPGPFSHHEGPGPHGPHGHHGPHGPGPEKMRAFAQARLLALLLDHEGGARQKVLAEEMRINPSSVSELISKLESEGYVVRTVDPDDKRATLITLTEVGRARAYELEDERNERFEKFFEPLTEEEKEQLLALMEKLMPAPQRENE